MPVGTTEATPGMVTTVDGMAVVMANGTVDGMEAMIPNPIPLLESPAKDPRALAESHPKVPAANPPRVPATNPPKALAASHQKVLVPVQARTAAIGFGWNTAIITATTTIGATTAGRAANTPASLARVAAANPGRVAAAAVEIVALTCPMTIGWMMDGRMTVKSSATLIFLIKMRLKS